MKIAFIANTSWSMVNFRTGVIENLTQQGHEIWIIAPEDDSSIYFERKNINFIHLNLSQYGSNPFKELKIVHQLYQLLQYHNFDIAFHYTLKLNIYVSLVCKFISIPSIMVVTGLGLFSLMGKSLKRGVIGFLHALSAEFADQIWVLNRGDESYFKSYLKTKSGKLKYLHGEGINLQHFKKSNDSITNNNKTFLFAARLIKEKGIYEYINAIRIFYQRHPNSEVTFKVAGFFCPNYPHAVRKNEMEAWTKEGLIEFVGYKKDIRPEISAATCLVLPSFYGEGMSRGIMEALAMETPVISTYNKGCEELISHQKTGYLIQKQNTVQLVEAFEYIDNLSVEQLSGMGHQCRHSIAVHFDEKDVIAAYQATLETYATIRERKRSEIWTLTPEKKASSFSSFFLKKPNY